MKIFAFITTFLLGISSTFAQEVRCLTGVGLPCMASERAPNMRTVVVFPTGYLSQQQDLFWSDFNRMVNIASFQALDAFTTLERDRLRYIGVFLAAGPLNTKDSLFEGAVLENPIRGKALSLDQDKVNDSIGSLIGRRIINANIDSALVLFNSIEGGITANASPPSFFGRRYGLAKVTRGQLDNIYIVPHELAHSLLNLLDEYTEAGFENLSVNLLDLLTPLFLVNKTGGFDLAIASLFQVYNIRGSEVLAANGNDNLDVTRFPNRAVDQNTVFNDFEYQGGMFFGLGTFRDAGKNLMNSDRMNQANDEGFAMAHNRSQMDLIDLAFRKIATPKRRNDRIRNAGPVSGWPFILGGHAQVLLFDADKSHHFQGTYSYEVQVGWYEKQWKVCWAAIFPYPCATEKWVSLSKIVPNTSYTVDLKTSALYGLVGFAQKVICHFGFGNFPIGGRTMNICAMELDSVAKNFLPTLVFPMPYQWVSVPVSHMFKTYFWRFRADNGYQISPWTGWSKMTRTF